MEGHVVKVNVPFDLVKLVTSLREAIDLRLLWATGLRRSAKWFGCKSPEFHRSCSLTHPVDCLKDDGGGTAPRSKRLQAG